MSASRNFAASSANPVSASAMLRLRFLRLWVIDAEHSSTPPLIDVVNFQQCRRMVGRPSCRLWLDAFKAKPGQIKLIDKDIDRPVLSSPNSHLTARETKYSHRRRSPTRKRGIASSGPIARESYQWRRFHTDWSLLGHSRLLRPAACCAA